MMRSKYRESLKILKSFPLIKVAFQLKDCGMGDLDIHIVDYPLLQGIVSDLSNGLYSQGGMLWM